MEPEEKSRQPHQATLRSLRNISIGLLLGGLIAGGFLAWSVISVMDRAGLTDPSSSLESNS